jgi:hypothetical protein
MAVVRHSGQTFDFVNSKTPFMKRSSFLKFGIAVGSLLAASFNSNARSKSQKREDKGFKVDAGK